MNAAQIESALVTDRVPGGLIDCHAHLSWPEFADDFGELIERAAQRGVVGGECVASELSFEFSLSTKSSFNGVDGRKRTPCHARARVVSALWVGSHRAGVWRAPGTLDCA